MHILLSGSHGFLGSALMASLAPMGHEVRRLVRASRMHPGDVSWDPAKGVIDQGALEGLDAVVHLAGESVLGRWTPDKKARIRDSRIHGTRLLAGALTRLTRPPRVLLSGSATGFYGDRGEELLSETSAPGTAFLAEVCREWEAASQPAVQQGIRVAYLRSGMVLSPQGGALAKMLPAFRAGVGGRLGNGRQYMSWITLEDWLAAATYALETVSLRGPVNLVAPQPVTNREFTSALGRSLNRPAICPVPAFALRLLLGEMAQELLLGSARATPAALLSSGFSFRDPALDGAFLRMLGGAA